MEALNIVIPGLILLSIYLGSFLGVLLIAAVLAFVWSKLGKKSFLPRFILCGGIVVGMLAWLAVHPVIVDRSGSDTPLSQGDREIILYVSTGPYNRLLLLPPVAVKITQRNMSTGDMVWNVYYFPFGYTTMEWWEGEGYNCARHLFPT